MQLNTANTADFLQLNALLQQTLAFAADNPYQHRPLCPARFAAFGAQMQQLFVFSERWQLLPELIQLCQAEQIAELYPDTQSGLFDLLYSCPLPADAEHWFDYQQEYQARTRQIDNLSRLIHWHQLLYQHLLQRFPLLQLPCCTPVAVETGSHHRIDSADSEAPADNTVLPTSVTASAGNATADNVLPALLL